MDLVKVENSDYETYEMPLYRRDACRKDARRTNTVHKTSGHHFLLNNLQSRQITKIAIMTNKIYNSINVLLDIR